MRDEQIAWGDGAAERERRAAGELAVTCAWIADKGAVRSLMLAARWRDDVLPSLLGRSAPVSWARRAWVGLRARVLSHPVDAWLARDGAGLPRNARAALHDAYARDHRDTRGVLDACHLLEDGEAPRARAAAVLAEVYRNGLAVRRDLQALRAVQSLAVLDVRNYRDLVFRIGEFAADGEDPGLGAALP